ncbi:efflux RND transporter periplasmic adaptor subunit [Clostridium botulinum]|uniref:efflux RND transporter periplasmic adaptor subunit n=1 Tax=Clostridium TaxID=1485 RepID=UPI0013F9C0EF|nr:MULTISPECIES: efflux RND transporter periplasmic adaptor subunit [Clostridium]MCS6130757.1 efflux RND transporter periplasmic adaptor subunit [Clostridium botulinum]NFL44718.1 efflux RND transporter periplasmic adaptor subunit [Clostridium botulinum]NFL89157.1 efflux RND transporter periplasmic adaptor subunit [Clostridium botulinum]
MKKYLALLLLLFNMMWLVGCGNKDVVTEQEKSIAVSVKKSKSSEIENKNMFTGTTKVATETSITTEIGGTIEKTYVSLGQEVKKGDILLTLKGDDVNNSVNQAKAALELAQANYNNTTSGTIESQTNQLENSVKLAQLQYDEAKRNYDMYTALYQADAISEDQYKKIELSLNQAKQQLDIAQKSYTTTTEKNIPELQELAEKQLEQAKVSYDVATSNLNKLTLVSPVDGVITAKNCDSNEMISQQQPAFVISSPNTLEVNINVAQSDINKFSAGQDVEVVVDGQTINGKVEYVPLVVDSQTSLYQIKILIDNSSNTLKAGMSVEVNLSLEKNENTITIPKKAVFEEEGKKYLYIVNDETRAIKTAVETGIETATDVEIKSGINSDDTVVIGGITLITDGSKVFPVEKED